MCLSENIVDELLGPLSIHFEAADLAYNDYLDSGGSFLFACSLRRINASARGILLAKAYLLGGEMRSYAVELIRHYDVWITLWDEHAATNKHAFSDRFAFESALPFPHDAKQSLKRYLDEQSAKLSAGDLE